MKLGRHGTVTAEQARTLAIQALADVAKGNDPLEDRNSACKAISVKELCELYMAELEAGRILGKGGRPKKASTKITDLGRITRHIIPLLGSKRVTHVTKARRDGDDEGHHGRKGFSTRAPAHRLMCCAPMPWLRRQKRPFRRSKQDVTMLWPSWQC